MKMRQMLKRFWNEEEGLGTVEIVIIIAVLVTVALIFRKALVGFVEKLVKDLFSAENSEKITDIEAPKVT